MDGNYEAPADFDGNGNNEGVNKNSGGKSKPNESTPENQKNQSIKKEDLLDFNDEIRRDQLDLLDTYGNYPNNHSMTGDNKATN